MINRHGMVNSSFEPSGATGWRFWSIWECQLFSTIHLNGIEMIDPLFFFQGKIFLASVNFSNLLLAISSGVCFAQTAVQRWKWCIDILTNRDMKSIPLGGLMQFPMKFVSGRFSCKVLMPIYNINGNSPAAYKTVWKNHSRHGITVSLFSFKFQSTI